MRLPYSWLKQYLPKLPPPNKLAAQMMLHGLDVEQVIEPADQFDRVVVGEILGIRPHPNADKLRITDVRIRPGGRPHEIVCGAPNIEVGQKVPVALIGAKLADGLKIEPRAIRGITSNGMICAADELGLGKNHAGIMVLDSKLKAGSPFAPAAGFDDPVLDLITPANRADLLAIRGLAWEIGAMLGQKVQFSSPPHLVTHRKGPASVKAEIFDPELGQVFVVQVIRGVTMKPTPTRIIQRLTQSGMRSINAIVDISNYIMLEYGQPLHAYDAAKVRGEKLMARRGKHSERIQTLDGQTRKVDEDTIVIADSAGPIGIAGVMGGQATEVSDTTTDVYLEAAIFNPAAIRRTSRQLGLVSEASKRFERGLWPSLTIQASVAAAELIAEVCGGTVEDGFSRAGTAISRPRPITLNPKFISERLGFSVTPAKAKKILTMLGFQVSARTVWSVQVPEWRLDVTQPEDLVDEVGRMMGYDKLPSIMPPVEAAKDIPRHFHFQEEIKNILVELGWTEIISHAFYGEADGQGGGTHFEVANPLDSTQQLLRKSLVPQVTDTLVRQAKAGQDAMVFELGRVFDPKLSGEIENQQPWKLSLGITHKDNRRLDDLLQAFQSAIKSQLSPELQTVSAELIRGRRIEVCQLDFSDLIKLSKLTLPAWNPDRNVARNVRVREQSKFPAIKRDISMFVPESLDFNRVVQLATTALGDQQTLLDFGNLKADWFRKDGKTSLTVHFIFRAYDRTLTKAEVDKLEQKIKDALINAGAEIR